MNAFVSLLSSCACAWPVRTSVSLGRIPRISAKSCAVGTLDLDATAISSSLPGFPNRPCAVGRSNPANVAPPIVPTDPNLTMPESLSCWTGPTACTLMVWPIVKCSLCAVDLSTTTSLRFGQLPSTRLSGLNGEAPRAMLKPRLGAPPYTIAFPSLPISCASPLTLPSATATAGSARTFASSPWSNVGAVTPVPSPRSKADLPLITASDPLRLSVKIDPNALSIESVRT